jgi:hypothetical protein
VNTGERKVAPDIVVTADANDARISDSFLEYAQVRCFVIDPALASKDS